MTEWGVCRHCGARFRVRTKHIRFYCNPVCNARAAIKRYHSKPEIRAKRNAYYREHWRRKRDNNERKIPTA